MGYQAKFNKAFEFQKKGDFLQASRIYRELIKKKPKLFDAQQMLGMCYHEQGELQNSIYHYQQALSINPKHTATLNNLGNAFLDAGQLDNAKNQLEKALKIDPGHAAAYNNLGNYYQKTREYSSAIGAYNKAIAHNPAEARYHDNLGVVYYKIGKFNESLETLQAAHNLSPSFTPPLIHMFDLLTMTHQINDAANLAISCLQQSSLSESEKVELHIGISKIAWLLGDLNLAKQHLSLSSLVHQNFDDHPNIVNLRVFHNYISQLIEYREHHPDLYPKPVNNTLVMLSESHGFAPSQTQVNYQPNYEKSNINQREVHQILSYTVTGCKVWHLAQSENNMYKESIKIFMSKIPAQCSVIIGFGEIDCRTNEGIYYHCKQTGFSFEDVIPSMIESYVKRVLSYASHYQHKILFYGVPAPKKERLAELPNQEEFIKLIRVFNQSLQQSAAKHQCDFLDAYQMTCDASGVSNDQWHIDNIHLKPESFSHLFANYLIRPYTV